MSVFLNKPKSSWVAVNDLAFAIRDAFPVNPGHTLVIPKRPVPTWAQATREERIALMDLVEEVRLQLQDEFQPDGFNIGVNLGQAAGQTVMHLHVHVIPRFHADVNDPRGGVRHVIPAKGNYRKPGHIPRVPPLTTGETDPFLDHLAPLIGRADHIRIVAAFVRSSGLDLIRPRLASALDRGASVQLLTGDYLNLTQVNALESLLDWAHADARLQARVIEVDRLSGSRSFHPKAWILSGQQWETVFVGSSNLSRAALTDGVEWNLRSEDKPAREAARAAFDALWSRARQIDSAWLEDYARKAQQRQRPLPFDEPEESGPPPSPRDVQADALAALAKVRTEGRDRAIVALATGLGKTWLAAFDVDAVRAQAGRVPRTLLVAHRKELLTQAARTFRRLFPRVRFGWFVGPHEEPSGDIVFASVQKLTGRLEEFAPDAFDYIIIDEAHHAAADSYLKLLGHFTPAFWLGLTATPERADSRSIYGLFHDEVAFEADLGRGIALKHLVPFAYFGLADTTDYKPIPWRNHRFSVQELTQALQTQTRMERLWEALEAHPGTRSLIFCCSIDHARFVRSWLSDKGLRVAAVHSKKGGDDRSVSLDRLSAGDLDAICTVDLFNEGIDVPMVDRVVMLRPTESSIVFLQQMGRGLRVAEGKERLVVIDFVGNHHVFLNRVRTLLNLVGNTNHSVRELKKGPLLLPEGCSVDVELEAVALLEKLLPSGEGDVVVRTYRELHAAWQRRPKAGELSRMRVNPGASRIRKTHGSWLGFVSSEGDLSAEEQEAFDAHSDWFGELGTTNMDKSFKMVTLLAMLEADQLVSGMALEELAWAAHKILKRSPQLWPDLEGVKRLPSPLDPDPKAWIRYWRDNPVRVWSKGRFFNNENGKLGLSRPPKPEHSEAFSVLTQELVDWRLHAYRRRRTHEQPGAAFTCKVLRNGQGPILKLPDRERFAVPEVGEHDVRLPDGSFWRFRFVKLFLNVARPVGSRKNKLPDLLREWFGMDAGQPGTQFRVRFTPSTEGWRIEPIEPVTNVVYPSFGRLRAFPGLQVAAGFTETAAGQRPTNLDEVYLPGTTEASLWATRASGDSMNGGREPIRDGDWMVFEWRRDAPISEVRWRIACVARGEHETLHVKRIVEEDGKLMLRSENPAFESLPAESGDRVLALLRRVLRPEDLAPERLAMGSLTELFSWVDGEPDSGPVRLGGHLFLLLDAPGQATSPVSVACLVPVIQAAETAFVLHRVGKRWRYLGVGRSEDGRVWMLPEMDYQAWSALRAEGSRVGVSRALPETALQAARAFLAGLGPGQSFTRDGRTLRIEGAGERGGVRVSSPQWDRIRSISETDIAWVLLARKKTDGPLDQGKVNGLRYIEGTPRASTRWLDTGHAIQVVEGQAD